MLVRCNERGELTCVGLEKSFLDCLPCISWRNKLKFERPVDDRECQPEQKSDECKTSSAFALDAHPTAALSAQLHHTHRRKRSRVLENSEMKLEYMHSKSSFQFLWGMQSGQERSSCRQLAQMQFGNGATRNNR